MKKLIGTFAIVTLMTFGIIACDSANNTAPEPTADETVLESNIVETAVANGSFSTLVTALEATGLDETLQGEGPFTVFAPTDDAFALLPEGTLESLLADTDALSNILLYHVLSGNLIATDVLANSFLTTVQGDDVEISTDEEGNAFVNDSQIIITDIATSNGTIHVIDAVLIP